MCILSPDTDFSLFYPVSLSPPGVLTSTTTSCPKYSLVKQERSHDENGIKRLTLYRTCIAHLKAGHFVDKRYHPAGTQETEGLNCPYCWEENPQRHVERFVTYTCDRIAGLRGCVSLGIVRSRCQYRIQHARILLGNSWERKGGKWRKLR